MRTALLTAVALLLLGYLCTGAFLGYRAYKGPAAHSLKEFLAQGRRPAATRTLVVTAGDSLTQGSFSADYVEFLRHDMAYKGLEFVNAGVNGATVSEVLQQTPEILACRPDAITILIGTNDVRAYLDAQLEHTPNRQGDSPDHFRDEIESLIALLRSGSVSRLAMLSIPPIGEDLLSPANRAVEEYNEVIQEACSRNHVTYLPLYETARATIAAFPHRSNMAKGPSRELSRDVAIRRFFLWQTWDQISRSNGFVMHTDGIHLNSRGARLVSDLVEAWLAEGAAR